MSQKHKISAVLWWIKKYLLVTVSLVPCPNTTVIQFVHMAVQKPPDSHWWGEWNWNILLRPTFTVNISFTSSVCFYSQTLLDLRTDSQSSAASRKSGGQLTHFSQNSGGRKEWKKVEQQRSRERLKDAGPERFPKELHEFGSETELQGWWQTITRFQWWDCLYYC